MSDLDVQLHGLALLVDMLSGEFAVYTTKHLRNGDLVAVVRVLRWQRRAALAAFCLSACLVAHFLINGQFAESAATLIVSAIVAASAASVTRKLAKQNENLVEQVMLQ